MADEKKFAAKRSDFYIRCIKTPVNKRKSKQEKKLQNPLRTRAKNERGAQKYPLRENTLHHSSNYMIFSGLLPRIIGFKI